MTKILRRHYEENVSALEEALKESRAVLSSAPTQPPRRFSRRLETSGEATNVSDLLLCHPCTNGESIASNHGDDVAAESKGPSAVASAVLEAAPVIPSASHTNALPPVSVRFRLPRGLNWTTKRPAIPFEGVHEPRPTGTSPAFLKTHFATEDEQDLSYVPYFGEDDSEDVVSELYNTERRERMVEFGPEYKERETNRVIEETLKLADEKLGGNVGTKNALLLKRIEGAFVALLEIDPDRIHHRIQPQEGSPSACVRKNPPETKYLGAIDSYRECFCRRCFTYDCNMHGCQSKPNIQMQDELALEKERMGYWKGVSVCEATTIPMYERFASHADPLSLF